LDLKSLQRSASDLKSALDASAKQSRFLKDFFDQLTKGFNDLLEVNICEFVRIESS
jgi:hypothetical protein